MPRELHLALDASLLVALRRTAELWLETVVRGERLEGRLHHPSPALEHVLDRWRQVVEPDVPEDATEHLERPHEAFEQRFAGLIRRRVREAPA